MLSDIERKLLRIICNYEAGRHRIPCIPELCIKTGRDSSDVMDILSTLTQEGYIEWSRKEPAKIRIKKRWERKEMWS